MLPISSEPAYARRESTLPPVAFPTFTVPSRNFRPCSLATDSLTVEKFAPVSKITSSLCPLIFTATLESPAMSFVRGIFVSPEEENVCAGRSRAAFQISPEFRISSTDLLSLTFLPIATAESVAVCADL